MQPSQLTPGPALTSSFPMPTFRIVVVVMSLGLAIHPYPSIEQPSSDAYGGVYVASK